jgi:hypothetical protein
MGAVAVLGAYSAAITAVDTADDTLTSVALLKQKNAELEEQELGPGAVGFGGLSGVFSDSAESYQWEVENSSAPRPNLIERRVVVWRSGRDRHHTVTTWRRRSTGW